MVSAFPRGSLVRLRTGLPAELRVTGVTDNHRGPAAVSVSVIWIGPDGRFQRALLPASTLELASEPGVMDPDARDPVGTVDHPGC